MRKYLLTILLALPVLLTGCFGWDYSTCTDGNNCELHFVLAGDNGDVTFADVVRSIDYVVYDEDLNFVTKNSVAVSSMTGNNNVLRIFLKPGNYYIVCWGNVGANSEIVAGEGSDFGASYITTKGVANNGCPLYYGPCNEERSGAVKNPTPPTPAPASDDIDNPFVPVTGYEVYAFTAPVKGHNEKRVEIVRAHRKINVFIAGSLDVFDDEDPVIKITDMPYKYDFLYEVDADIRDYEETSAREIVGAAETEMSVVHFSIPIDLINDDTEVALYKKDGTLVAIDAGGTLILKDYVEKEKPEDVNDFDILFTIGMNAEIEVSMPDWDNIPIEPGN